MILYTYKESKAGPVPEWLKGALNDPIGGSPFSLPDTMIGNNIPIDFHEGNTSDSKSHFDPDGVVGEVFHPEGQYSLVIRGNIGRFHIEAAAEKGGAVSHVG